MKPRFSLIHALPVRAGDARDLRAHGSNISDEIANLLFLEVLLEVYDVFLETIG